MTSDTFGAASADLWGRIMLDYHVGLAAEYAFRRDDGYLDFAYVAPDAMGQGVAKALYDAILAVAEKAGLARLTSEASHLARRFFERQGWRVVEEQSVARNGVTLTNFRMEIDLRDDR